MAGRVAVANDPRVGARRACGTHTPHLPNSFFASYMWEVATLARVFLLSCVAWLKHQEAEHGPPVTTATDQFWDGFRGAVFSPEF